MKNTFGNAISFTLFGESHGKSIGFILDGMPAGVPVDLNFINKLLSLRKPQKNIGTPRQEADEIIFESGVKNGFTTGSPIMLRIENQNTKSSDYNQFLDIPRPGHADYVSLVKYRGFADMSGGGHFSGRLTAPIVALGGLIIPALNKKGINVGSHILSINNAYDKPFSSDINVLNSEISSLLDKDFAVLNNDAKDKMTAKIIAAKEIQNSVGGIIETAVTGMPAGAGEPWFDSIESIISHAMFAIPAVKGIEFGKGFEFANILGTESNDEFMLSSTGNVVTKTNNNGGINGGITNGMPILFKTVIKPTPTVAFSQNTLNLKTKNVEPLVCKGRHDPCIVPRANIVITSLTAFCIADILTNKYGTDWMAL